MCARFHEWYILSVQQECLPLGGIEKHLWVEKHLKSKLNNENGKEDKRKKDNKSEVEGAQAMTGRLKGAMNIQRITIAIEINYS